ncbi:hypothetical protein [Aquimarina spongiae]|nr:hypothetical protein [Aquimarina spongiae]
MQQLSVWVGKNVLGINYEITIGFNGSGDTTSNYIVHFIIAVMSLIIMVIWSIIDFKRQNYDKVLLYFRAFIRYYVASILFVYGFGKVIPLQFSELNNFDLIKTFGDQSPMGLMWNFMEYSDTYTRFSGFAEVIAGALLLFRKTVVFGAIVVIGVMFNVFMMNMSYDIPGKLYSGLITMMGLFLLSPDIKRILNFFILNKTVYPKTILPYFSNSKYQKTVLIFKVLFIGFLIYNNLGGAIKNQEKWGKKAPKPALYGIYEVEEFIQNNDTLPPLATDSIRWKRIIVDKWYSGIQTMDEKIIRFKEETDTISKTLKLTSNTDSTDVMSFYFKQKDSLFYFETIYKGDTLKIKTEKKPREDFLLINRGFHWISERPFNR